MNEKINFLFELFINLFQGIVFTLFCNSFFTPKFKKWINTTICAGVTLLLFAVITLINLTNTSIANIEIVLYLAIIVPFSVFCHKGKTFLKIVMPVISFVILMCIAMGFTTILSVVFNKNVEQVIAASTVYRFLYVIITNITFVFILYLIYRIYKDKIDIKKPTDVILCFVIPILTMIIVFLATSVITDAATSETNRIYLGIISVIAFVVAFSMFALMKQITKAAELKTLNIVMAKEQEMYKEEISNQNKYIEEISHVKHEMKRKLAHINHLISNGDIESAKGICKTSELELKEISPVFRTDNIYLNAILNKTYAKATERNIVTQFTIKSNLKDINTLDLVSLLGNLIDNAFDALENVTGEKNMHITIFEKERYYIISVKNSINKSVLDSNPHLKTTKSDKKAHGQGLKIIRNIVDKNNGNISFKEKENCFIVSLMLEIIAK